MSTEDVFSYTLSLKRLGAMSILSSATCSWNSKRKTTQHKSLEQA